MGQLNLKDPLLVAEAKELAALRGTSVTAAVREAVHERLEREKRAKQEAIEKKIAEMTAWVEEYSKHFHGPPMTQQEMDDMLYDPKTGLPW
jgi:antitoxin VapB